MLTFENPREMVVRTSDRFRNRMQTSICSDVFYRNSAGDAEKLAEPYHLVPWLPAWWFHVCKCCLVSGNKTVLIVLCMLTLTLESESQLAFLVVFRSLLKLALAASSPFI